MELGAYDITFVPRQAIKSQALVGFIAEWTNAIPDKGEQESEYWMMYFDGSFTLQSAGTGIVYISPTGESLRYIVQIYFDGATNNVAEYEGLLTGLNIAISLGIQRLLVKGDS